LPLSTPVFIDRFSAFMTVLILIPAILPLGGPTSLLGWATGTLFLMAVLARLARFNVEAKLESAKPHLYFQGMPGISAAVTVAASILALQRLDAHGLLPPALAESSGIALLVAALVMAGLMVSRLPYADLPKHYGSGRLPWWHLVVFAAAAFLVGPEIAFALVMLGYMALSPFLARPGAGG